LMNEKEKIKKKIPMVDQTRAKELFVARLIRKGWIQFRKDLGDLMGGNLDVPQKDTPLPMEEDKSPSWATLATIGGGGVSPTESKTKRIKTERIKTEPHVLTPKQEEEFPLESMTRENMAKQASESLTPRSRTIMFHFQITMSRWFSQKPEWFGVNVYNVCSFPSLQLLCIGTILDVTIPSMDQNGPRFRGQFEVLQRLKRQRYLEWGREFSKDSWKKTAKLFLIPTSRPPKREQPQRRKVESFLMPQSRYG